ncbi:hypothetical protein TNCV_64111 [Trichonephila clavipes]|nr:hypothetical protein TNCV_64111 [Trichonephila clavipes]
MATPVFIEQHRKYLQSDDITCAQLAFSPDLNPKEHEWDMLGRRVVARQSPPLCGKKSNGGRSGDRVGHRTGLPCPYMPSSVNHIHEYRNEPEFHHVPSLIIVHSQSFTGLFSQIVVLTGTLLKAQ